MILLLLCSAASFVDVDESPAAVQMLAAGAFVSDAMFRVDS